MDFVIHKTTTVTVRRHPRIPFITYLHFQTAHPELGSPLGATPFVNVSGHPNSLVAEGFGVISHHSDSVKPKINKKHAFCHFFSLGDLAVMKALSPTEP